MCKEEKLYKLIYCCSELKEDMKKCKNLALDIGLKIKEDKAFITCRECQAERIEALAYDYSKDE